MTNTIRSTFQAPFRAFKTGPSRFPGMSICYLLLLFLLITSCNGKDKTPVPAAGASDVKTTPATPSNSQLPAEDPSFVIVQDTVSTHGPRSITRNVLLDRHGNLWFASWEGVVRYDGKHFTNMTLKEGLRHFHVFSVMEDSAGNLWFGTIGGGVYRYDGTAFRYFTTLDGLASNLVSCMLEDQSGNIWLGTDKGLSRYDGTAFVNFTKQDGISLDFIYSIVQDKTGILWFGTNSGIIQFDGQTFAHFTNKEGLPPFYRVHSMIEDASGNIWIGSADGLCRYDPATSLKTGEKSMTGFTTNSTSTIFEDKTGNIWLSENKVNQPDMILTRYDGKSFTKITSKVQIFGIEQDRTGNIWFGTMNGVCRYDGRSFSTF